MHCTHIYTNIYQYHIYNIYIYIFLKTLYIHFCIFCATETFLQFCSRCTAEEITPAEGEIFWEDGEFCMALNYQWRKATETNKHNDPCTGDNDCDSDQFCCYDFLNTGVNKWKWWQTSIGPCSWGWFLWFKSEQQVPRMNMLPMQQTPREVEGFSPWKMVLTCFNNLRICFAGVRFFPLSHLRYLFRYIVCKKHTRNWFSLECRHMCNHVNTLSLVSTWHPRCWIGQKWACNMQEMFCWNLRGHRPAVRLGSSTSQSNNAWVTHGLRKRSWRASWGTKTGRSTKSQ